MAERAAALQMLRIMVTPPRLHLYSQSLNRWSSNPLEDEEQKVEQAEDL